MNTSSTSFSSFALLDTSFCDDVGILDNPKPGPRRGKRPTPSREYSARITAIDLVDHDDEKELSASNLDLVREPSISDLRPSHLRRRSLTPTDAEDNENVVIEQQPSSRSAALYQRQQTIEMAKLTAKIQTYEAQLEAKEKECDMLRNLLAVASSGTPQHTTGGRRSASTIDVGNTEKKPRALGWQVSFKLDTSESSDNASSHQKCPNSPRKSKVRVDAMNMPSPTKSPMKKAKAKVDVNSSVAPTSPAKKSKAKVDSNSSMGAPSSPTKGPRSPRKSMAGRRMGSATALGSMVKDKFVDWRSTH